MSAVIVVALTGFGGCAVLVEAWWCGPGLSLAFRACEADVGSVIGVCDSGGLAVDCGGAFVCRHSVTSRFPVGSVVWWLSGTTG